MTRVAKLDYAPIAIKMLVTTAIEEKYRINACAKEPWTVAWIEAMPPGSVLYDVGANVGSYTLLAAALGHTVVAIEPAFANYARLCENILLNDLGPKVIPFCLAIGSEGIASMQVEPQPGYSGGTKLLQTPYLTLLDLWGTFAAPDPTHIKIDVDGAELDVLTGMASNWHPLLMVEFSAPGTASAERLAQDPVGCSSPKAQRAYDLLTNVLHYRCTERFVGTGTKPIAWYGSFEPSA